LGDVRLAQTGELGANLRPLLSHEPFQLILIAIPTFKNRINARVVDWPLLMVSK
jgi:hypothetical protein